MSMELNREMTTNSGTVIKKYYSSSDSESLSLNSVQILRYLTPPLGIVNRCLTFYRYLLLEVPGFLQVPVFLQVPDFLQVPAISNIFLFKANVSRFSIHLLVLLL